MENHIGNAIKGVKEGPGRRRYSDTVAIEASADSTKISGVGMALKSIPNSNNKTGPLYPTLTSHWMQVAPEKSL